MLKASRSLAPAMFWGAVGCAERGCVVAKMFTSATSFISRAIILAF